MRNYIIIAALLSISVSGCSLFGVYKIDIPQGAPLTKEQAARVKVGMSAEQVMYLLGSPTINSTLAPKRWDYVYDYTPGTYGKKASLNPSHREQRLSVYFGDDNRVSAIKGLKSIPLVQKTLPIEDEF